MRENLNVLIITILIIIAVAAIIYSVVVTVKSSKMIYRLDNMIERAFEGEFKAKEYSESRVSALECRFADFLNSSITTEADLLLEKERIKTMISDISHQTKTPIANLLLYSELLGESEELTAEGRNSVDMIHEQTEKLHFLIDALVKLSRLESGIVTLNCENNSVNELIDSVVTELSNKAKAKGLAFGFAEDGTEDLQAHFDSKWTREALINIVDNAIKYTNEGFVEIRVSTTDVFARIDIKDSGIGIGEEDSTKIFQRFYRASTVSNEEGVGIGLYLAREIITDEGGYIKLKSVKGEGTIFSVFIPVK